MILRFFAQDSWTCGRWLSRVLPGQAGFQRLFKGLADVDIIALLESKMPITKSQAANRPTGEFAEFGRSQ
jgi:hypothetical protein